MSDAHHEEAFIKTPKQLITVIVASFVIPIALIVMLASYVTGGFRTGAGSEGLSDAAVNARLKPVAIDVIPNDPASLAANEAAGAAPAPAPGAAPAAPVQITADTGKKIFEAACQACHGTGVAGAPKFADKAAWAPRIGKGKDTLYTHALKGFNAMPPKGGSSASDEEIKAAVDYIVAASK